MSISRSLRRKLVYLAYCVAAKEVKHCQIRQSDLVRRYPDINYGLYITSTTEAQSKRISKALTEAFDRRGFEIYTNKVNGPELEVSGFYPKA